MTRSKESTTLVTRASLLLGALLAAIPGAGCALEDLDSTSEEEEIGTAAQEIVVPAGTRFVVPKGLTAVKAGVVLVSTIASDPTTGGEQGKSCPFENAKKTESGDTACGYNNQQQWVCCDATCDYTCRINQHNNMQYWNTDSCTVVESTCEVRSGGPGGGGFDIFQTEPAGG